MVPLLRLFWSRIIPLLVSFATSPIPMTWVPLRQPMPTLYLPLRSPAMVLMMLSIFMLTQILIGLLLSPTYRGNKNEKTSSPKEGFPSRFQERCVACPQEKYCPSHARRIPHVAYCNFDRVLLYYPCRPQGRELKQKCKLPELDVSEFWPYSLIKGLIYEL